MTTMSQFIKENGLDHKEVPDGTKTLFPCRSRVQAWAMKNLGMLIFLSVMFFISWAIAILIGIGVLPHYG